MIKRKNHKDNCMCSSCRASRGDHPMYGLMPEETPNWRGGASFEPYGLEFNDKLKERIRERDNYTCQECKMHQDELGYKLPIHHIDYDKQNNLMDNLIALCRSCHAQTNFGREDWTDYFNARILERGKGNKKFV